MARNKYEEGQLVSLAEGFMAMSQKGIIIGPSVRLTKKRANVLRSLMKDAVYNVPDCEHTGTLVDDCNCNDDWYAAIAWVNQQIQKRYSIFDFSK